MEKLPIFQSNEVKNFKFSIEQYVYLEMEYNRFTIYKEIVKNIETLLKINQSSTDFTNRKLYENKNIIDRFILECINHGISPHLSKIKDLGYEIDTVEDMNLVSNYLFFNKMMNDEVLLRNTKYFQKMISEYTEKKIKITTDKVYLFCSNSS